MCVMAASLSRLKVFPLPGPGRAAGCIPGFVFTNSAPVLGGASVVQCRGVHHAVVPRGRGGRSSFSGLAVTAFGGNGFLGRYVVNRLAREGSQIILPHRCDEYDVMYMRPMADLGQLLMFPGFSIRDTDRIMKMIEHSNVVINMIGQDSETWSYSFEEVNVEWPRRLGEMCRDVGVKKLVHLSALNSDISHSTSKQLRTKARGEDVLRDVFPDATIIKPSMMFGREDRYFNFYARQRRMPFIPMISLGKKTVKQPVYVSDVARAVCEAVCRADSVGETYELVGPKAYVLYDLVDYIYRMIHYPFRPLPVPRTLLRGALAITEKSGPFIPLLTRERVEMFHQSDSVTLGSQGLSALDVTPTDVETAAIRGLRFFRQYAWFKSLAEDTEGPKTVPNI